MFKVDLNRFLKITSIYFLNLLGCPKKQNKFQVDEILKCYTFLVDGHLKFTYALSTSKVKIIIYQSFNVKTFFKHNSINQFQKYFGVKTQSIRHKNNYCS
jgi:hypothetical protein